MIPVFVKKKHWIICIIYMLCLSLINQEPPICAAGKDNDISLQIKENVIKYDLNYYAKITWFCIAALATLQLTPIGIKKLVKFFPLKKDFSMLMMGILLNLPTLISLGFFFNALFSPKILIQFYKSKHKAYFTIGKGTCIPLKNIRYIAIIRYPNESKSIQELHFYIKKPAGVYILEYRRMHNAASMHNLINFLEGEGINTIEAD